MDITMLIAAAASAVMTNIILVILFIAERKRNRAVESELLNRLMSKDFTDYSKNVPLVDPELAQKRAQINAVYDKEDSEEEEVTEFPVV